MPPLPELADDPVGEILLRIPPEEDPACLFRASLVCKRWRRILADPSFRRRHRAFHRTAAVFGFIFIVRGSLPFSSRFVPIDPSSRRPAPATSLTGSCSTAATAAPFSSPHPKTQGPGKPWTSSSGTSLTNLYACVESLLTNSGFKYASIEFSVLLEAHTVLVMVILGSETKICGYVFTVQLEVDGSLGVGTLQEFFLCCDNSRVLAIAGIC